VWRFGAYAQEFERRAETPEQKELAAGFQGFVGEVRAVERSAAFQKLLEDRAARPRGKEADRDLER